MFKAAVTAIAAIVAVFPAFARQTGLPPSSPAEWTQGQAPFRCGIQNRKSIAFLRKTPCDLLLTPHPDASGLWDRIAKRDAGDRNALAGRGQCSRYANRAETGLRTRLAREKTQ